MPVFISEAATGQKVFLKIMQHLQENTCDVAFF